MTKKISSYIKITLIYFLFSILWIYFSDATINLLFEDVDKLQFFQTIKGGLFVSISSVILYFYSKRQFINLQNEKSINKFISDQIRKFSPLDYLKQARGTTYFVINDGDDKVYSYYESES